MSDHAPPRSRARAGRGRSTLVAALAWLAGIVLATRGAASKDPPERFLDGIVFVSRQPVPGETGAVPGLGPHHRAITVGGRLLMRDARGRIRPLLPDGAFYDVADPAVSWDGKTVAFAGVTSPDAGWRIYLVDLDGKRRRAVTGASDPEAGRVDDIDPCWISDTALCFASTREHRRAQYADVPVTNLYTVRTDGSALQRITAERNGAEEPAFDLRTGTLVYSRWWFNRYRPGDDSTGITTDPARALPGDSVNLWQAVEIAANGSVFRLAAGAIGSRRGTMAYQPAILADGSLAGVYAGNLGLWPLPGGTGIQRFPDRYGSARRVLGPILDDAAGSVYGNPRGLAAPTACAPAGLPDGRMLLAYDRGARGDFGIYMSDGWGGSLEKLVDLPGTLELDPAPVIVRHAPAGMPERSAFVPATGNGTFTYFCRNLFANGALDSPVPNGPRLAPNLTLRFFALPARADLAFGDSAMLVREAPVGPTGEVLAEGLPAGTPMFEQLVDSTGRAVMTAHGPAHVMGANFGTASRTSRCVGCHLGHSTLSAEGSDEDLRWFDAAPSAEVTASSSAPGTAGPRAAVDRRTLGPASEVAWIAGGDTGEWLRLSWRVPIEVRALVFHPPRFDHRERTDSRIDYAEISLRRGGRLLKRFGLESPLDPPGTRIEVEDLVVDRVEIRIARARGTAAGFAAVAIAEVETIARLPSNP